MKIDAYWTIFRNGTEVIVWDEVNDKPLKKHCKKFESIPEADAYIQNFLKEWTPKIAILDKIMDI